LSAKRYKVAVSADFGVLFINEKIRGEPSGSRIGAKLVPEHFSMTMSGGEDRAVEFHFAQTCLAAMAVWGQQALPLFQGLRELAGAFVS
jgi:hypothetical protein